MGVRLWNSRTGGSGRTRLNAGTSSRSLLRVLQSAPITYSPTGPITHLCSKPLATLFPTKLKQTLKKIFQQTSAIAMLSAHSPNRLRMRISPKIPVTGHQPATCRTTTLSKTHDCRSARMPGTRRSALAAGDANKWENGRRRRPVMVRLRSCGPAGLLTR